MKKIIELLKEKKFTYSVEIISPRNGTDINELYQQIDKIKDKVDFVSVTKGAGGSLRGGTLPITFFAQEKFSLSAISHFVCREHTKQEIENELTDLHYFGIKNILALRGDAPVGAKDEVWSGDYQYAYLLVQQIKNMNNGIYLPTPTMKTPTREGLPTDFCIIVAGHPENPIEEEIEHLKCKISAGADVIITQMIFSFEEYKNYVDRLRKAGINLPVIAGVRPLVDFSQADSVERFFGIKVADEIMNGLKEINDKKESQQLSEEEAKQKSREFGINYTKETIRKLQEYCCPGVHLFVLNDIEMVNELLE